MGFALMAWKGSIMSPATREAARKSISIVDVASCPKCGSSMGETLRCEKNRGLVVWYRCRNSECAGQSLMEYGGY